MMMRAVNIPARRGSEVLVATLRYEVGDICKVAVELADGTSARGEGADLFDALVATRLILEPLGILLACAGARRDVYPSPMLRQATQGRRAYVLAERANQTRPPSVDIFDIAEWDSISSVNEQRDSFLAWLGQPPDGSALE
jgi:hypothetical protein